ncbi:MAG: permease-like cell division protein FtsX [Solirubrobacteraceae bacterium]
MKYSLGFFLRESLRAMRRNAAPSFAALATVAVTMVVIGVFIPIVQATRGAAQSVSSRVMVDVFMKTDAKRADDRRVMRELRALPGVQRVVFESKQQALAQQNKANRQAIALLNGNPLPDAFHVYPVKPSQALFVRSEILGTSSGGSGHLIDTAISRVSQHEQDTKQILTVTKFVTITAALLAALLTLASVVLIGNTIRLSLYARRREIEVMRLVGATNWFIRWPFVIEGVIVGALGALAAIIVLAVAKLVLLDPLANNWKLIAAPKTIGFIPLLLVLVVVGVAVSSLGSGLSLRRFLRV